MRLRQVALVAADLEPALDALRDVLALGEPFRDPGVGEFGLANGVFALGDTFLEVVAPVRPDTTAGRYLERRGGDGGYMVILQSDDLDADRARLRELGVRVVWQLDLPDIRGTHLHPKDIGGAIVSIDQPLPPESWRWAGPTWQTDPPSTLTTGIVGVQVQCADPSAMAARWGEVLDQPVAGSAVDLTGGGAIRFAADRDGRGDGVSGVQVAVADADEVRRRADALGALADDGTVRLCGTTFVLADAATPA